MYVNSDLARRVAEDGASPDDLTDREREVLRHLALGESNKAIGEVLCVSEETVKTHVGHILGKLGVENRAQAVVQALKRGLVSLEEIAIAGRQLLKPPRSLRPPAPPRRRPAHA